MEFYETKTLKRLVLGIVVCLILTSFIQYPSSSQNKKMASEKIAENILPTTVLIEMKNPATGQISQGSGFFVKPSIIATNFHVVEGMSQGIAKGIRLEKEYRLEGIVEYDRKNDLALLKTTQKSENHIDLATSFNTIDLLKEPDTSINILESEPESEKQESKNRSEKIDLDQIPVDIGEKIYAIGNPQGLAGTFSEGLVSSKRFFNGTHFLQIDAPISSGSSGGPIVNQNGNVVGVATSTFGSGQNLNFAVYATYLKKLLNEAKDSNYSVQSLSKNVNKKQESLNGIFGVQWGTELSEVLRRVKSRLGTPEKAQGKSLTYRTGNRVRVFFRFNERSELMLGSISVRVGNTDRCFKMTRDILRKLRTQKLLNISRTLKRLNKDIKEKCRGMKTLSRNETSFLRLYQDPISNASIYLMFTPLNNSDEYQIQVAFGSSESEIYLNGVEGILK